VVVAAEVAAVETPTMSSAQPAAKKGKVAKDHVCQRPSSAYMIFLKETSKAENPDLSGLELRKVMSDSENRLLAKWRELTPEGKALFEQKAKADKERYATEKAAYESRMAAEEVGVAPTHRSRDCAADTAAAAAAAAATAATAAA